MTRRKRRRRRLERPLSSQGGAALRYSGIPEKARTAGNGSAAIQGRLQRSKPRGDLFRLCRWSVQSGRVQGKRRVASAFSCASRRSASAELGCAKTIIETAGAARLPTAARRCGSRETAQLLSRRARRRRDVRAWHRDGAASDSGESGFLVPDRARPRACRAAGRCISLAMSSWRRVCRSSSGAAFQTISCSTWRLAASFGSPRILEQQVRRMLADKRSEALVDNFAEQWLYLRNLAAVTPDPKLFPDFDDNLRQAFRRETSLFFESIKNEDRSVLDLLNANYTFVNERLAHHYGIPNVYGTHFRRVTLPEDSHAAGPPRPGKHSDRDVVRQPDVARSAGQMGPGEPARHASASASAERTASEGEQARRRKGALRSGANGGASCEPGLRVLPFGDGSDRTVGREFRRDRPLADHRR